MYYTGGSDQQVNDMAAYTLWGFGTAASNGAAAATASQDASGGMSAQSIADVVAQHWAAVQAGTDSTPTTDWSDAIGTGTSSTTEWVSFLLMIVGWFVLLTSLLSYWRVSRWARSIRADGAIANAGMEAPASRMIPLQEIVTSGHPSHGDEDDGEEVRPARRGMTFSMETFRRNAQFVGRGVGGMYEEIRDSGARFVALADGRPPT